MAIETPNDAVLLRDHRPQLQPIRLPAEGLMHLHRVTAERLKAFVLDHLERFPQQAGYTAQQR